MRSPTPMQLVSCVSQAALGVQIHVLPMGQGLQPESLAEKISKSKHWTQVVAFRPTGGPAH